MADPPQCEPSLTAANVMDVVQKELKRGSVMDVVQKELREAEVKDSYKRVEQQLKKHEQMLQTLIDRTAPGKMQCQSDESPTKQTSSSSQKTSSSSQNAERPQRMRSKSVSEYGSPERVDKRGVGSLASVHDIPDIVPVPRTTGSLASLSNSSSQSFGALKFGRKSQETRIPAVPEACEATVPVSSTSLSSASTLASEMMMRHEQSDLSLASEPPKARQVRIGGSQDDGGHRNSRLSGIFPVAVQSYAKRVSGIVKEPDSWLKRNMSRMMPDTYGTVSRCSAEDMPQYDAYAMGEQGRSSWRKHVMRQMGSQLQMGGRSARHTRGMQSVANQQRGWLILWMADFTDSRTFASVCAFIVMANVVFVGYETTASMSDTLAGVDDRLESQLFRSVHRAFDIIFLSELVLRIYVCKWYFIFGPDSRYNLLDLLLVAVSAVEELLALFGINGIAVVRQLRMLKVIRLCRMLRFFSDLRLMVASIVQSCSSLTWALLLLLAIMYLFAIVFMHGMLLMLKDQGKNEELRSIAELWYRDLFRAMLTLLQCITSGVDWDTISRPLSWYYTLLFAFYVTFVVIGVLNVLTGIFVERASELSGLDRDLIVQSHLKRDRTFLQQMSNIFEEADVDHSGSITWSEFKEYLKNQEIRAYLSAQQLDACDARQLFDLLDSEGKSEVRMPDFIMGLSRLRGMAKSVDLVALLKETREFQSQVSKFIFSTNKKLERIAVKDPGRGESFASSSADGCDLVDHDIDSDHCSNDDDDENNNQQFRTSLFSDSSFFNGDSDVNSVRGVDSAQRTSIFKQPQSPPPSLPMQVEDAELEDADDDFSLSHRSTTGTVV